MKTENKRGSNLHLVDRPRGKFRCIHCLDTKLCRNCHGWEVNGVTGCMYCGYTGDCPWCKERER